MSLGINSNILHLQGFINNKYALESLVAEQKPNIIALQETHIINKNKKMLHLPGCNIYHHNKNYTYAKSDVALLIKNNINVIQHSKSLGDFYTIA